MNDEASTSAREGWTGVTGLQDSAIEPVAGLIIPIRKVKNIVMYLDRESYRIDVVVLPH